MNNVNSLFDSLTVSAPALGADTPSATAAGEPASQRPSAVPPVRAQRAQVASEQTLPPLAVPSYLNPPIGTVTKAAAPAVSAPLMVGSTGLIARVDAQEFVKVVAGSGGGVTVLLTAKGAAAAGQRDAALRYVTCVGGIVLITNSNTPLHLGAGVQIIAAQAVLCEGRPLSNDDYM